MTLYINSSFAIATNIVDATPKGNISSMAMIEPASAHPHFLLCNANTPPTMGNTASIIDNTTRIISMVVKREATKGKSSAGIMSRKNVQITTVVKTMMNPITPNALIAPVIKFKTPAMVGFQVFCIVVSI